MIHGSAMEAPQCRRSPFLFLVLLLLTLASLRPALADTAVKIVNPINGSVGTPTRVSAKNNPVNYLINGVAFDADAVNIYIFLRSGAQPGSPTATVPVKHGTWEYMWDPSTFADTNLVKIVAVGVKKTNASPANGESADATATTSADFIYIDKQAVNPSGSISIFPSSVDSGLYINKSQPTGKVNIQMRAVAFGGQKIAKYGLAETAAPTLTALDTAAINNDNNASFAVSFTFTPAAATPVRTLFARYQDDAGAPLTSFDFVRAILVDDNEPTVTFNAPTSILKTIGDSTKVMILSGTATDAAGVNGNYVSGISEVRVLAHLIGTPAANVQIFPATLTIGGAGTTTSTAANWQVELPSTIAGGSYDFTAVAYDNAGNASVSTLAAANKTSVAIDRTNPAASISSIAAAGAQTTQAGFVYGTINFAFTATDAGSGVYSYQFLDTFGANTSFLTAPITTAVASPFTFNSATLPDGSHDFRLRVYDNQGNTVTTGVTTVTIDNTAPTVTLTAPAAAAFVRGSAVAITGSVSDTNIFAWTLKDGATTLTSGITNGPVSFTWDTTAVANGAHTLTLTATDQAGNITTKSVSVTVDNGTPTITLFDVSLKNTVSGVIYVKGNPVTISATVATTNLTNWVLYDGATQLATGAGASVSFGWDTTAVTDGTHTLRLVAAYSAGNVLTSTLPVVVDNTAPAAVISAPVTGAFVRGSSVGIIITVQDTNIATWVLKDGAATLTSNTNNGTGTFVWDTTAVANGAHTIMLTATDKAGTSTSTTITLNVDNANPAITAFDITPKNTVGGIIYVKGAAETISATVPQTNLTGWVLKDGSTQLATAASGNVSFTPWDTTAVPDGAHLLSVTATYAGGNVTTATLSVIVDNALPVVSIVAPTVGATVRGNAAAIIGSVCDTNIASWTLKDGVITLTSGTANGAVSFAWNTTVGTPDGAHTLTLTATDKAGNSAAYAVNVTVDNSNNSISGFDVTPKNTVGGIIYVKGNSVAIAATIPQTNLTGWVLKDGLTQLAAAANGNVGFSWDTTATFEGLHTLNITASYSGGNTLSATLPVIVDNTAPTVSLTAPSNNAFVRGNAVHIKGSVLDTNIATWTLKDGATTLTGDVINSTIDYTWNTTVGTPDGPHTITLMATDKAGTSTSTTITLNVDNSNPAITAFDVMTKNTVGGVIYVKGAAETISATVPQTNLTGWVLKDGSTQLAAAASGNVSFTPWDTTAVSDGTHALNVTATYAAGNTAVGNLSVIVDNTAPTVAIISPAANAFVRGSTVHITGSVFDTNIATWTLKDGAATLTSGTANGAIDYTWNTTAAADGAHTITLTATDKASTSTSTSIVLNVDNAVQTITGFDVAPKLVDAGINYVKGSPTITATISNSSSTLVSWVLQDTLNTTTQIGSGTTGGLISVPWTPLDGKHILTLTATYKAGNTVTQTLLATVDNIAPSVTFTFPANLTDTPVPLNSTLTASVQEVNPGTAGQKTLRSVIVTLLNSDGTDGASANISLSATFNPATGVLSIPLSSDTSALIGQGAHLRFDVTVTDLAGNVSGLATTKVQVNFSATTQLAGIEQLLNVTENGDSFTVSIPHFTPDNHLDAYAYQTLDQVNGVYAYIKDTLQVLGTIQDLRLRKYTLDILKPDGSPAQGGSFAKVSTEQIERQLSLLNSPGSFQGLTLGNATTAEHPENGKYLLRFKVFGVNDLVLSDFVGYPGLEALTFPIVFDTVLPVVAFDDTRTPNEFITKGPFTIRGTLSDAYPRAISDTKSIKLLLNGAEETGVSVRRSLDSATQLSISKTYTADGTYNFQINGIDRSGNQGFSPSQSRTGGTPQPTRVVLIDNVPPTIQPIILSPAFHVGGSESGGRQADILSGMVRVQTSITDNFAVPYNKVGYKIRIKPAGGTLQQETQLTSVGLAPVNNPIVVDFPFDTNRFPNGQYVITISAADLAGNSAGEVQTQGVVYISNTGAGNTLVPAAVLMAFSSTNLITASKIPTADTENFATFQAFFEETTQLVGTDAQMTTEDLTKPANADKLVVPSWGTNPFYDLATPPVGKPNTLNPSLGDNTLYVNRNGYVLEAVVKNHAKAALTEKYNDYLQGAAPATASKTYVLDGLVNRINGNPNLSIPFTFAVARNGSQTPQTAAAMPGRHQYLLLATDTQLRAQSATMNVVVDNSSPRVNMSLPIANINGNKQVYSLGDILVLDFYVVNPETNPSLYSQSERPELYLSSGTPRLKMDDTRDFAPIKRLPFNGVLQSAPDVSLTIMRGPTFTGTARSYSLAAALQAPNLADAGKDGQVIVTGDPLKNGYHVTWQIRLFSANYSAGVDYRLELRGLQDVAGNPAISSPADMDTVFNDGTGKYSGFGRVFHVGN